MPSSCLHNGIDPLVLLQSLKKKDYRITKYHPKYHLIMILISRYFSQGSIDENNYISENSNSFYGIVTYQAADCLPHLCTDTFGPFSSPTKVLGAIERLE